MAEDAKVKSAQEERGNLKRGRLRRKARKKRRRRGRKGIERKMKKTRI